MKPGRMGVCALALVSVAVLGVDVTRAEDQRGRWTLGFGLSLQSTLDDVRNNASIVVSKENDSFRLPDGDLSNDRIIVFDPRADDLLNRETKVEERQRFEFSAGYGLNSWLSLQFDVGYYQGDVSPVDVQSSFERWAEPLNTSPEQFEVVTEIVSLPITAGELTQIPVSLNAMVRFRKDSPFNPYLGIGMGYMFNDLEVNGSLDDINRQILRGFNRVMQVPTDESTDTLINIQEVSVGFVSLENQNINEGEAPNFVYNVDCTTIGSSDDQANILNSCTARDPDPNRAAALAGQSFLKTEVDDSFFWQFSLGADYHFNDRTSAYVVARYQVTNAKVNVSCTGPNTIVGRTGELEVNGVFEADQCIFRFISESNPALVTAAGEEIDNRFIRSALGSGSVRTDRGLTLQDQILFQGGEIDLTAFTVGAGIRFTF